MNQVLSVSFSIIAGPYYATLLLLLLLTQQPLFLALSLLSLLRATATAVAAPVAAVANSRCSLVLLLCSTHC